MFDFQSGLDTSRQLLYGSDESGAVIGSFSRKKGEKYEWCTSTFFTFFFFLKQKLMPTLQYTLIAHIDDNVVKNESRRKNS